MPAEEYRGSAGWRVVIAVAVAALTGLVSLVRYELFRSGASLPYYVQALYALAHQGPAAVSSWAFHQPILGVHGPLILLPLSYLMAAGGLGLVLVVQAAAVGIGFVYLDDWLAAQGTPWPRRRVMGWAYLLSSLLWGMVGQDFHPLVLAVPALMAAATLLDRGRVAAGLVALTVALLCGFSLLPAALVLALVLAARQRPAAALAAAAWSAAATLAALSATGARLAVLLGLPAHLAAPAATSHVALYVGYLLVPVLVFGVSAGTLWLLPALWIMAVNIGIGTPAATSPFASPSALAAPFLLLALAATLADGRFWRWRRLSMAVYVLMFVVFLGHEAGLRHDGPPLGQLTAVTAAMAVVPAHATVVTVPYTAAHLAARAHLLPLVGAPLWPAHSYVVVDTTYTAPIPAGALPPALARLKRDAKIKYSFDGMWVFYLPHQERGL